MSPGLRIVMSPLTRVPLYPIALLVTSLQLLSLLVLQGTSLAQKPSSHPPLLQNVTSLALPTPFVFKALPTWLVMPPWHCPYSAQHLYSLLPSHVLCPYFSFTFFYSNPSRQVQFKISPHLGILSGFELHKGLQPDYLTCPSSAPWEPSTVRASEYLTAPSRTENAHNASVKQ